MKKLDNNLSDIFDVNPIGEEPKNEIAKVESGDKNIDNNINDDYHETRKNLYDILEQGKDALLHALAVAKNSEHPRAFEVVGGLMKQLSDINTQLVDLHTKKAELESKSDKQDNGPSTVTNNAIFVGSTSELSKMIENMKKGA